MLLAACLQCFCSQPSVHLEVWSEDQTTWVEKMVLKDLRRFLFWLSSCYTSSVARSYLVFPNSRERILLSCFCLFSSPKVCIILDSVFWETVQDICASPIFILAYVSFHLFFLLTLIKSGLTSELSEWYSKYSLNSLSPC